MGAARGPFPDPMTNVASFIEMFFGAKLITDSFESDVATVTNNPTQLVAQNPRRVALHIIPTGSLSLIVSRLNTVTVTTGQIVAPGESFDLYWYNELREIEKNWFCVTPSGVSTTVHIREVVFV